MPMLRPPCSFLVFYSKIARVEEISLAIFRYEHGKSQDNDKKSPDMPWSNLSDFTQKDSRSDNSKYCITGTPSSFATKGFCQTKHAKYRQQSRQSDQFTRDTPLWEKIAVGGGRNVKGQRYTLSDETSGEFVNYAEIWGQNLYLKAVGKFNDKGSVSSSIGPYAESSNNPFEFLAPLVANLRGKEQLKPTPYDYEAIVTGASFVLFQKYSFDVAIAGKGVVRVLYADPNLRIFLSPTDTNVTTGGGDWESAGLIVVQVRFDLVYSDWNDRLLGV
eukprot:CCRYP_012165-RA/>CCRYP_012165-RA protein AED:0.03 eAED:0.03 QI:211/1/1/1/0/0/2/320/273